MPNNQTSSLEQCTLRCHVNLPSPRQSASLFGDSGNEIDA